METTGRRFCNIISAVSNKGTLRFSVFEGGFNQDVMIDFLARLVRDAQRKVIVIADGHPAHKGAKLKRWLAAHAGECELVLLPAYAPELNPDEVLNRPEGEWFGSADDQATDDAPDAVVPVIDAKRPDVVKSFFEETHVAYAAG